MNLFTRTALGASACIALVVPGGAQAAQRDVDMGTPLKSQKTFEKTGSDVNAFFPRRTTIHVGDTVRFRPVGFHTLDIPAKGKKQIPIIVPAGQKISGANDAAGNPFWFNGLDALGFRPALVPPNLAFGKRLTYTGKARVESGLPVIQKPKPVTVKFSKRGSYTYYCDVHYGMKGTVRVVSERKSIASAKAHARAAKDQVAAALKVAKGLAASVSPAVNTVSVGAEGARGVTFLGFLPENLTVARGTTVRFQMPARSTELHTATTGPGNPEKEPNSYLGGIINSQTPVFDPRLMYPSDPPPAVAGITTASHGNGFWSSGALARDPLTPQVPAENSVRFDGAGTYEFYCMIHPFMHGTITVT